MHHKRYHSQLEATSQWTSLNKRPGTSAVRGDVPALLLNHSAFRAKVAQHKKNERHGNKLSKTSILLEAWLRRPSVSGQENATFFSCLKTPPRMSSFIYLRCRSPLPVCTCGTAENVIVTLRRTP